MKILPGPISPNNFIILVIFLMLDLFGKIELFSGKNQNFKDLRDERFRNEDTRVSIFSFLPVFLRSEYSSEICLKMTIFSRICNEK